MHYLSSRAGIEALVETALSNRVSYVYGIVLDLYTQRSLCCNCNVGLLGIQNSYEHGFLRELFQAFRSERIQPRDKLLFNTRVSLNAYDKKHAPLREPQDREMIHIYNPDFDNKVFQSENSNFQNQINPEISLGTYEGAFFSSKSFSKKTLERKYAEKNVSHSFTI